MSCSVFYCPSRHFPSRPWLRAKEEGPFARFATLAEATAAREAPKTKRNHSNPLRQDPTRTTALRARFMRDLRQTFTAFSKHLQEFLVGVDALGMKDKDLPVPFSQILRNAQPREYQFLTDDKKLEAFSEWVKQQVAADILSPDPDTDPGTPWTSEYMRSAYKRGLMNGYVSSKQAKLLAEAGVGDVPAEQFLRGAFNAPEATSKIRLLSTRSWQGLQGITDSMGNELNRLLAQGMADGRGIDDIARQMRERVGFSKNRAMTFARTEIINAHSEGQLDSFEKLGIDQLGIQAEWSTAGDDRVCPECDSLNGKTYTVKDARGLIPYHPNCRCSWIPSEVSTKPPTPATPAVKPISKSKQAQAEFREKVKKVLEGVPHEEDENPYFYQKRQAVALQEFLKESRPGKRFSGSVFSSVDMDLKDKALRSENFLRDVVDPKLLQKSVVVKKIGGRAYYHPPVSNYPGSLNIDMFDDPTIVTHEFGHHLQTNPKIMKAEKAFLRKRAGITGNSKPQTINEMPGEIGFPGDFTLKGGTSYTGRVYGLTKIGGKWDWDIGEVMSTGLERLHRDPAWFHKQDPDFFFFIVNQIQSR